MRGRLLEEAAGHRTFALAFDPGDEIGAELARFAAEQSIVAAELRGIGGCSEVTLAYFDREKLDYLPLPVREQVEVVSLVGNITLSQGKPKVHAHLVIGRRDGSTLAGHLLAARVWPTLELFLTAYAQPLERHLDPATKLPLL
jgi:uncharacterized protein